MTTTLEETRVAVAIKTAAPAASAPQTTISGEKTAAPPPPPGRPLKNADKQWVTRRRLAYALLAILAVLVGAALVAMFTGTDLTRIKDVMAIVFGPVAGLVGAAVGFYFGAKTGSETPGSNEPRPGA
jgi:hypothetical protein